MFKRGTFSTVLWARSRNQDKTQEKLNEIVGTAPISSTVWTQDSVPDARRALTKTLSVNTPIVFNYKIKENFFLNMFPWI